jgi:hypothetical protein
MSDPLMMEFPVLLSVSRLRRWPLAVALAAVVGVALSFLALSHGASSASAAGGTFRNPVGTGPDPYMTYYNGFYYLTMTEGRRRRSTTTPPPGCAAART